jgi:CheY-like chemotaxis protein
MSNKNRIFLLADDDFEDQEILEETILQLEPQASLVKLQNGLQVIEYLVNCQKSELPCIIILDFKMPIYNAAEVLERIGNNVLYENIPKVVWSSSKQPEHVKLCMDSGAVNYFVKPNRIAELISMAQEMIKISNKNMP